MTGTIRLFFALWPDDSVRANLAAYATKAHARAGGRAMRPETLHITLAFLGDTSADRLETLLAAAATLAPQAASLVLDETGYWRHNRIIWAGASIVPQPIAALVADLRAALAEARFTFDSKPFLPHVTLLRKAAPSGPLPAMQPIEWRVTRFVLVRSTLDATGSRYEIAGEWSAVGEA